MLTDEPTERGDGFTYRDAGVDLDAADAVKRRLRKLVDSTRTGDVRAEFGSFGGRLALDGPAELVMSADGVGTKLKVAFLAGRHDTIGEDLVNHCVDDLLAEGAVPLAFLDYFACGRLEPETVLAVVEGVARGCRRNGCALLGGETAEMPGFYREGEYDLAGFALGRLEFPSVAARELREGDVLLGLPASGLHTNGFSFVRALLFQRLGLEPHDEWPGLGLPVAEILLRVHRSYLEPLREPCAEGRVHALAHVTGGGIPGNLGRVLPEGLDAIVRLGSWTPPSEFLFLARESGATREEIYRTLNMGIGMIAVVRPGDSAAVLRALGSAGCPSLRIGELAPGAGRVRLVDGD